MNIPVYNMAGEVVRHIDVSDTVFAQPANDAVVHQTLVAQQANARHGTSDTKTRSEVAGSTRKLYRQKHTGRARAGNIKSGLRRGGAIIFGPHPRDYSQVLPRKMRRLAIRCILSAKAADEGLVVLDELKLNEVKTREMLKVLKALGIEKSVIIALPEADENIIKSAHNLPSVKTVPARQLSVKDMLSFEKLLITETALRQIEELWGGAA